MAAPVLTEDQTHEAIVVAVDAATDASPLLFTRVHAGEEYWIAEGRLPSKPAGLAPISITVLEGDVEIRLRDLFTGDVIAFARFLPPSFPAAAEHVACLLRGYGLMTAGD